MRRNVRCERPDRAFRVAPAKPVRAELQRRAAQAELGIGAVHLAQEQLAFLDPAGAQAGHAECVQGGQIVRILLRGRTEHLDGPSESSLLDEDLPQLDARPPIVGIHGNLARQPGRPAQVAQRVPEAAQEPERVPVRDGVPEQEQDRGGQRIAGEPPQDGELHPSGHPRTLAASGMWAATGSRPTRAYWGLMAATTPVVMAGT